MLVLSIETSCDETSLSILESDSENNVDFLKYLNSFTVKSSVISSQIKIHLKYGGVVPEIGARQHAEHIHLLFFKLLRKINPTNFENNSLNSKDFELLKKLDYIFVTTEPGLVSALRVGREFAKTLNFFIQEKLGKTIEVKTVNHLDGHLASSFYNKKVDSGIFPHLHLIVSGGNTQILFLESWKNKKNLGQTLDDATGECLDKVGRMLGLPYPGGYNLAKIAKLEENNYFDFPISLAKDKTLNFSFSGLKTAVRYFIEKQKIDNFHFEKPLSDFEFEELQSSGHIFENPKLEFIYKASVSAQTVVVQQLFNKLKLAISQYNPSSLGISGGVSANLLLRKKLSSLNVKLLFPDLDLTGDNAVMIALAGLANLETLKNNS